MSIQKECDQKIKTSKKEQTKEKDNKKTKVVVSMVNAKNIFQGPVLQKSHPVKFLNPVAVERQISHVVLTNLKKVCSVLREYRNISTIHESRRFHLLESTF